MLQYAILTILVNLGKVFEILIILLDVCKCMIVCMLAPEQRPRVVHSFWGVAR